MEEKACERDVEIGVLRCQVDQLVGEQKSIRERVRANERVVAIEIGRASCRERV